MTKKDIVRIISDKIDLPQFKVKDIVQMTFEAIGETLAQEGRIELRNFGVFEVRTRRAHKARNPKTGESVHSPEKQVISFKAGKGMEAKVQKNRK
ncbi:MAG: integration host factor subunit beta [Thermoguttaceae bacterium]|jgi:nucleoid DNA-binding protein|nr:integration host factor subunit beta [Thermoguttaceae bacterium]MBQ6616658.1 integration host factor subunit beta [Thermoguttaceae bacterium]